MTDVTNKATSESEKPEVFKPKIRTVTRALQYFKERDPETPITRAMVNELIDGGKITSFKRGTTTYIRCSEVWEYVYNEPY